MSSFEVTSAPTSTEFVPTAPSPTPALLGAGPSEEAAPATLTMAQIDELVSEAFERGRAAGLAEQPPVDTSGLESAGGALLSAADSLRDQTREESTRSAEAAVELALTIAETVVRGALPQDFESLRSRIEAALAGLPGSEDATIHLNADDLEMCRNYQAGAMDALFARSDLGFEADASLGSGEAIVRRGDATIDARIDAMLEPFRVELQSLTASTGATR